MPSSSINNNNNNDRKRRGLVSTSTKKLRRTGLINNSKNEQQSQTLINTNSSIKINEIKQDYSLAMEINSNSRLSTLKPLMDSFDNNNSDIKRDLNSTKRENGSNENTSDPTNKKTTAPISLIVKPSTSIINKQDEIKTSLVSYDSDEEYEKTKQISNIILPVVVPSIMTSSDLITKKSLRTDNNVIIQQTDGNSNLSTKLLKLVVPQSTNLSSSIKMLSNGDGLSSALRVPTKIQLTKTLLGSSIISINQHQTSSTMDITEKQESTVDYPLTPPPPIIDNRNTNCHTLNKTGEQDRMNDNSGINIKGIEEIDSMTINNYQTLSKRHSSSLSDWSVPPTSELSPTSLTSSSPDLSQNNLIPDDSFIKHDFEINRKRRYRSLSISCPVLPYCGEQTKPITPPYKSKSLSRLSNLIHNKKNPIMKYSLIQRLKKRRRNNYQYDEKIFKLKRKIEHENIFIIKEILNEIIERIVSINDDVLKILLNTPVSELKTTIPLDFNPIQTEIEMKQCSSTDLIISVESRPMITASKELNQSSNIQGTEFEQNNGARKIQGRIHEITYQKKANYHKAILRRSKKSTQDVLISSTIDTITHSESLPLSSNDLTDTPSSTSINNPLFTELKRQTSTPLSFHSIASSSTDEQSILSPQNPLIVSKTNIFLDIVNELIKGAKGLDKLSCSLNNFTNSIHNFLRLTLEKQTEKVENLEKDLEKKCSLQLNRANIFCTQKIQYFINKHSIITINEYINDITLLIKYFYLFILSLNYRKQENEYEVALNDLINGKLIVNNQAFYSSILTTIIENFILTSSLANDYLASQPFVINQIEYSLPFIRNIELENELLYKNDTYEAMNPFSDINDLEDYLNRCEHMTAIIPYYPVQQSHHPPIYYPPYAHLSAPAQYYYPPTQSSDLAPYYYQNTSTYSNSQQAYAYNHPSSYYNPLTSYGSTYNNNEQLNYYYNQQQQQQTSYTYSQSNSTNDIPLSNNNSLHRSYRQMNSNLQRKYSNSSHENQTSITSAVFDTTNVGSPQPKSTATNNIYPS